MSIQKKLNNFELVTRKILQKQHKDKTTYEKTNCKPHPHQWVGVQQEICTKKKPRRFRRHPV